MREPSDTDRGLIDHAREALFEITEPETVGAVAGIAEGEDQALVEVFFHSTMPGYPGWRWNVSLSTVDGDDAPSVLETELVPGDGALLAPDWVPWADRLAEYRAAQAEAAAHEGEEDEDEDDLLDPDDDEIDGVDFEESTSDSDEDESDEDESDENDDDSDSDDDSDEDDDVVIVEEAEADGR